MVVVPLCLAFLVGGAPAGAADSRSVAQLDATFGRINCLAFSPDGKVLVSGYKDDFASGEGALDVWEVSTWKWRKAQVLRGGAYSLAFSPDGKTLAVGVYTRPTRKGEVVLMEADTGRTMTVLTGHTGGVCSVAFSPDGKNFCSVGRGVFGPFSRLDAEVKIWHVAPWKERATIVIGRNGSATFTPNGKAVAIAYGDKRSVSMWDVETESELVFGIHDRSVYSVAASPDGSTIVTAGGHWFAETESTKTSGEVNLRWRVR